MHAEKRFTKKTSQLYDTFLLYTERFFWRIKNLSFDLTNKHRPTRKDIEKSLHFILRNDEKQTDRGDNILFDEHGLT